ncbi:uncharacterized protein LOC134705073 [Mytilus trossulus]|uniref:uncharacterized protein LOC134705073 n=1 Tax=Mytilus trossulus TaxID=6551 RepID=UPI003004D83A
MFTVNKKTEIPGPSGHNEIDGKVRFTVTLLKFYTNGHEDNFPDRTVFLNAPLSGSLCSYIDFQLGKTYFLNVIGATRNFESYYFNGCHYSVSEENISNVERRLITGELDCPLEVLGVS